MSGYDKKFAQLGQLKEKQYIIIDDVVCRIDSMTKSKPGKHGSAKMRVTATGVFNNQKKNLLKPTVTNVEVPILDKGNAQVIADLGDKYQIMDTEDYQTYDIAKEDFKNLEAGSEIEYIKAGSLIKIVRKK